MPIHWNKSNENTGSIPSFANEKESFVLAAKEKDLVAGGNDCLLWLCEWERLGSRGRSPLLSPPYPLNPFFPLPPTILSIIPQFFSITINSCVSKYFSTKKGNKELLTVLLLFSIYSLVTRPIKKTTGIPVLPIFAWCQIFEWNNSKPKQRKYLGSFENFFLYVYLFHTIFLKLPMIPFFFTTILE